jgi:Protein of unknown function (DUF667)
MSFCDNTTHSSDVNEIDIVEDSELVKVVYEIGDNSRIVFPTNTQQTMLVLYLKNIDRFLEVVIQIIDSNGHHRRISLSNKRSFLSIKDRRRMAIFVS